MLCSVAALYNIVLSILFQFGNKIGEGQVHKPTYVYPETLKAVIRAIVPNDIANYRDPTGPRVSFVHFLSFTNRDFFFRASVFEGKLEK